MSDIFDRFKNLNNEINRKVNTFSDPLSSIIAAKQLNNHQELSAFTSISSTSAIAAYIQQQNAIKEKLSPFFTWQDTIRELSKPNHYENTASQVLSSVLGGSTISNMVRIASEASKPNAAMTAIELIKSHQNLFTKQLSVYEKIHKQFYKHNNFTTPSWIEQINIARDYKNATTISPFEALSAASLVSMLQTSGDDVEIEEPIERFDEVSLLIAENEELKSEIEVLLTALNKVKQKKKSLKKQIKELEDPLKKFSIYLHLKVFNNSEKWKLQHTYTLVHILNAIIIQTIILSVFFGKSLENYFFEDDNQINITINHTQNVSNNKQTSVINLFNNQELLGTAIDSTRVYRRKSFKTDCIGTLSKYTTVRIFQKKGDWFFIEAVLTKFDKRLNCEIEIVSRGWVKCEIISFKD